LSWCIVGYRLYWNLQICSPYCFVQLLYSVLNDKMVFLNHFLTYTKSCYDNDLLISLQYHLYKRQSSKSWLLIKQKFFFNFITDLDMNIPLFNGQWNNLLIYFLQVLSSCGVKQQSLTHCTMLTENIGYNIFFCVSTTSKKSFKKKKVSLFQ
jgi:hypothetical protein